MFPALAGQNRQSRELSLTPGTVDPHQIGNLSNHQNSTHRGHLHQERLLRPENLLRFMGGRSMLNILEERLVSSRFSHARVLWSFPEVYAALVSDEILDFPALRAHQRHPLHALLVQLGALACLRAGLTEPPATAGEWRDILRGLTPDHPDDAPWHLVSPPDRPAFLQPVVGPLNGLKSEIATPDGLDMLVTAKNHDLKRERMVDAGPEDWLFALVALQTSEGFLGAGNYGISRMNGGFANRPGLGLAPEGGIGRYVMRDMVRLIRMREQILDRYLQYDPQGTALLWLQPWDGTASLRPETLDPYYVEICRRVRLLEIDGKIAARAGGSKVARIATVKEAGGITGDPWTPIDKRSADHKALTVDARGFDYRRLSDILFGSGYEVSPLLNPADDETGDGWVVVARALARGQGKTEGYHERRVPIPAKVAGRMRSAALRSDLGRLAQGRIEDSAAVRGALRFALMTLFQNGPETFAPQDPSSARRADPYLDRFQTEVDRDFFEKMFDEAELAEDAVAAEKKRREWLFELLTRARHLLRAAEAGSPRSAVRQYRASVLAWDALDRGFFGNKLLKGRVRRDDAAA